MEYTYFAEFNRVVGDSIFRAKKRLQALGLVVDILPHPTTLRIRRPRDMRWAEFKSAIQSQLQARRGSVLLHSKHSGLIYICSNRSNRPGVFVRQ